MSRNFKLCRLVCTHSLIPLAASSSLAFVELYILVSSANNFTVDFSRAGKSFMYSKNSVGESSAPCGTGRFHRD